MSSGYGLQNFGLQNFQSDQWDAIIFEKHDLKACSLTNTIRIYVFCYEKFAPAIFSDCLAIQWTLHIIHTVWIMFKKKQTTDVESSRLVNYFQLHGVSGKNGALVRDRADLAWKCEIEHVWMKRITRTDVKKECRQTQHLVILTLVQQQQQPQPRQH